MARLSRSPIPLLDPAGAAFAGLVTFLAAAALAAVTRGYAGDEELRHFLAARYLPRHPDLLLDLRARPLLLLLLTLPGQMGLAAARLAAAAATGLTAWATVRAVRADEARRDSRVPVLLTAGFLLLQPFYLQHAAAAVSEPWAALLLALALLAVAERRTGGLAAAAGLLPFVRPELGVVTLAAALLVLRRRARWLPMVALPAAAWAVARLAAGRDFLDLHDETLLQFYAPRSPFHYGEALAWGVGAVVLPAVLAGAAAACRRPRPGTMAALVAVGLLLAVHTWFAAAASVTVGNLRYLAAAAPGFAVLAARGAAGLRRGERAAWVGWGAGAAGALSVWARRYAGDFETLPGWDPLPAVTATLLAVSVLAASRGRTGWAPVLAAVLGAGAFQIARDHGGRPPFRATPEQTAVTATAAWIPTEVRPVFTTGHPLVAYLLDRDPYDPASSPHVEQAVLERPPPGSGMLWESHYGPLRLPGVSAAALVERPGWTARRGLVSADSSWVGVWLEAGAPGSGAPAPGWLAGAQRVEAGVPAARARAARRPADPRRRVELAERLLAAGDSAAAETLLASVDPSLPEALLVHAKLCAGTGGRDRARELCGVVLAADSSNGEARLLLGSLLLDEAGRLDPGTRAAARENILAAADLLPQRWEAQYMAGNLLLVDGLPARAEIYLAAALRDRPDDPATLRAAARAAEANGDTALAEHRLRRWVRQNPRDPDGYRELAAWLDRRGHPAAADSVHADGGRTAGDGALPR